MIFRPERGHGVTVGVLATVWPLALGIGILARTSDADITAGTFLLIALAGVLLLVGLAFGYWTYACATMSYELTDTALRIRWGLHDVNVPLSQIDVIAAAPAPERVIGLNWPGHHVGRAYLQQTAVAHVFATEFIENEAVYVRAGKLILALTPIDPTAFVDEVEQRRRNAPPFVAPRRTPAMDARSVLIDRAFQAMAAAAAVLNIAAFGVLFARYDDLPDALRVDYPVSSEAAHVVQKADLFAIPLTGLALFVLNLGLGILIHRRQRALAQTVAGGTVFLQVSLVVAILLAVR